MREFYVKVHADTKKRQWFSSCIIAKNKKRLPQSSKIEFIAYSDGFYYVPRIDKQLIQQYHEDIIVNWRIKWRKFLIKF
jgi:DNA polymerase-3 subunit alpha